MTTSKKKAVTGSASRTTSTSPGGMKTMDVDPRWLEEIRAGSGLTKGDPKRSAPVVKDKANANANANVKVGAGASGPPQRLTMEVDVAWLEDVHGEAAPAAGSAKAAPDGRKVVPPPLPPPAPKPKRKAPPPIPREDTEDVAAKPAPRRSTRPPKR